MIWSKKSKTSEARILELEEQLDATLSAIKIADLQTEISTLQTLINDWQTNYTNLLRFLEGTDSPNTLRIIEPATLPTFPISPDIQLSVMLAAGTGFMLALAAAFVLEFLDNTI